jgi:hypothetical protein
MGGTEDATMFGPEHYFYARIAVELTLFAPIALVAVLLYLLGFLKLPAMGATLAFCLVAGFCSFYVDAYFVPAIDPPSDFWKWIFRVGAMMLGWGSGQGVHEILSKRSSQSQTSTPRE